MDQIELHYNLCSEVFLLEYYLRTANESLLTRRGECLLLNLSTKQLFEVHFYGIRTNVDDGF